MRIALICDVSLRAYLLRVFQNHPEMDAEIACFPALKSVNAAEYQGIPVVHIDVLEETGCDTALIAVYSPERVAIALEKLKRFHGIRCYILHPAVLEDRDFIRFGEFDSRCVFPVRETGGQLRIVLDPYDWFYNEGGLLRESREAYRETINGLREQTRAVFYGKMHRQQRPDKLAQKAEDATKLCFITPVFSVTNAKNERISPATGPAIEGSIYTSLLSSFSASVIGAVGDDVYGKEMLETLDTFQIGHRNLHILPGGITGHIRLYTTEDGNRYNLPGTSCAGANASLRLNSGDIEEILASDYVITNSSLPCFWQLLELSRMSAFRLVVDFDDCKDYQFIESTLFGVDVLFLSGEGADEEALLPYFRRWSEKHDGIFVLTLADRGSAAFHRGETYRIAAEPVPHIESTGGCGDIYKTAFVCSYAKKKDIPMAMKAGTLAAKNKILLNNGQMSWPELLKELRANLEGS